MEQQLQLAFAQIDRSAAYDERIEDLLAAAESYLPEDTVRTLYYANEALMLAETGDRDALELRALRLIIDAMKTTGRASDATPYIVRAIDLAESIRDAGLLSALVDALGTWAIDVEQEQPQRQGGRRSSVDWAVATIARLERDYAQQQGATSPDDHRSEISIDDAETGLLNALGLAAELLSLEELQTDYAVIQIVLPESDPALLVAASRQAAQMVGDRGFVARNGTSLLTAVLPLFTGIAAMAMAEHLRVAFLKLTGETDATIGIGVAIRQRGESSRDVLRRVTDRAEEASYSLGVTVVG